MQHNRNLLSIAMLINKFPIVGPSNLTRWHQTSCSDTSSRLIQANRSLCLPLAPPKSHLLPRHVCYRVPANSRLPQLGNTRWVVAKMATGNCWVTLLRSQRQNLKGRKAMEGLSHRPEPGKGTGINEAIPRENLTPFYPDSMSHPGLHCLRPDLIIRQSLISS